MLISDTLVTYYSNTGSNKYLAEKIAQRLNADIEPIRPRIDNVPFLVTCSLLKFGPGIHPLRHEPVNYHRMIVCGPIWTGQLIAPVRDTIRKYQDDVDEIVFVTCCGSRDKDKDGKYGYDTVFEKAREAAGGKMSFCKALPVYLVLPEDKWEDSEAIMNARLSDENFNGEIADRFEAFIDELETETVAA